MSLRSIAEETVEIARQGGYRTAAGHWVDISAAVAGAVAGTRLYLPDEALPVVPAAVRASGPVVEVTSESTLDAGRRLGEGCAALVFASARNPGGGFLGGAKAQEEAIARSSALYACQTTVPEYYEHHRSVRDLRYSDRVIYAPAVPVFRDNQLRLLDQPYRIGMLVAAAPNLGAILRNRPELAGTVPAVLRARAVRVLRVAAAHGHRQLALGAWGCGAFRNDPVLVAEVFAAALREVDAFDRVVFAVLDRRPGAPARTAFAAHFGAGVH
ncbi:MAG: TIGR02452 family protein [Micromonosporaceae bacterium]|nr:TIGR02452 family protein [Micromonosporaceae bacterium]